MRSRLARLTFITALALHGGCLSAQPAPTRGGSHWINPAQLTAMVARGRDASDAKSTQARLQRAGLAGRVIIKGQVVMRRSSYFIEHVDGPFRSRLSVSTDISLADHVGRTVVVSGVFDELPNVIAFLRKTRLEADTSGLSASPEPMEPGLYRVAVDVDQLRTAPGKGVDPRQVHAVFMSIDSGVRYAEHAWILLRDGTLYDRAGLPPSDLNLVVSRQHEPQRWRRWKPAGDGRIEWQRHDDHGRPLDKWQITRGTMANPWPADSKLTGTYTAMSFHGSVGLGGTYNERRLKFEHNGRFSESRFTRSSSGSLAAQQGVSANASSHSDKTGSRSSTGAAAPGVAISGSGRRDDGADHRGSYRLDGYAMELRYDSGRIERVLSFPVPWSRPAVFVRDAIYSIPDKK